ncbi:hypothetical protein AU255_11665 [Methyloprofundus sedimenti]|uniref:Uracil-DNA glycosylase-like domain-containing protein n=1 Tax=Methyloprofundus sedimenti TaxID=1420851 RepID=A0A1V8MA17_9GAMM|nr:hypothetical protein [Methyloprofundus sedimenti]OQK18440.1 hypothetical protein AU255_11665 [Methyloprofundus sedimenti]
MEVSPQNTLDLLEKLESQGFTNTHFQSIHHWGGVKGKDSSLVSHKKYLAKQNAKYQINGNNYDVAIKLKHCYEIASSTQDRLNFFRICKTVNSDSEQEDINTEKPKQVPFTTLEDKLDNILLAKYIESFYGYGNYEGDIWFIGMEEGGGSSLLEIQNRLNTWNHHLKPELEDIYLFHTGIQVDEYFRQQPKFQNTWKQLIRILLTYQGKNADLEACKLYQRDKLARHNSDHCLIELLPLPSPSAASWLYGKYSNIETLKSRELYTLSNVDRRIAHLKERIKVHQPEIVIFYGMSYVDYWKKIAGQDLQLSNTHLGKFFYANNTETKYLIMNHPAAHGVTNQYFSDIGIFLQNM